VIVKNSVERIVGDVVTFVIVVLAAAWAVVTRR